MRLDARYTLEEANDFWVNCRECHLGVNREERNAYFVSGMGTPKWKQGSPCILFLDEAPGWQEESKGDPWSGKGGQLLKQVIDHFGLQEAYLTNIVPCRSCEQIMDDKNEPMVRETKYGKKFLIYRDVQPTAQNIKACRERLMQEIYLVDPLLIVTLGKNATSALLGGACDIMNERGKEQTVEIPGVLYDPKITTAGNWGKATGGTVTFPLERRTVKYMVIPTFHMSFVLRKVADRGKDSPMNLFLSDIHKACKVYDRYMMESGSSAVSIISKKEIDEFGVTAEEMHEREH